MKHAIYFTDKSKGVLLRLALVLLPFLLTACITEELCEDVESVPVRMGFYLENPDSDIPFNAAIANLTVFGLGTDSLIYNYRQNVGQVELPLNPTIDSCAFVFVYSSPLESFLNPILNDTIWFVYERIPVLISMECGFANFFMIEEIRHTRNIIGYIEIEEPNITSSLDEHVKIFPLVDPAVD